MHECIAEDPGILGLGELVLKDVERIQPGSGRLDLLLQDPETGRRYEVEVQLGPTDPHHIIRTIEYWDIEQERYPQYDHCAVLVAEEITGRFFNVIRLFNRHIPIIAIQMQALKFGDDIALVFTRVLDERKLGPDDTDGPDEEANRQWWEQRSSKESMELVDELLRIIQGFEPGFGLKYNKAFIGLTLDGRPYNFATFVPIKKAAVRLTFRMESSAEVDSKISDAGLERLRGSPGRYCVRVTREDLESNRGLIGELLKASYETW